MIDLKNTAGIYTVIILLFGSILLSCSDDEEVTEASLDEALASSEDDALADAEFTAVFEFVDDEASLDDTFGNRLTDDSENTPECAVVSRDTENHTLIIDFGSEGCLCNDGLTRSGRIVASFEGAYREPGSSASVSLENYTVEGIAFNGSKTITNMREEDGHFLYTVQVANASITNGNSTISWESSYTIERIEGNNTIRPYDDVYQVTGSAQGINRNGVSYTKEITTPLVKDRRLGCFKYFIEGQINISNSDGGELILNYGDGQCDRLAEMTFNGQTVGVLLR